MKIEAFLLCDAATESGGKLNILGAFDSISAPSVPAHHLYFVATARIRFLSHEEGTHVFELNMLDTSGKSTVRSHAEATVKVDSKTKSAVTNLIFKFINLPLENFGEYTFELFIDNNLISSHPLFLSGMNMESPK